VGRGELEREKQRTGGLAGGEFQVARGKPWVGEQKEKNKRLLGWRKQNGIYTSFHFQTREGFKKTKVTEESELRERDKTGKAIAGDRDEKKNRRG